MAFMAGSIIGDLGLNVSGFSSALRSAEKDAERGGAAIGSAISGAITAAVGVSVAALGTLVGAAGTIGTIIAGAAERFDDMGEAAERAGVSVSFLSSLGSMAKDAGASVADLEQSLVFLGKNAAGAVSGDKETTLKFQQLGISIEQVKNLLGDREGLFDLVTSKLGELATSAEKTDTAMGLLGRGGNVLLPFMSQGTEGFAKWIALSKELGASIDDDAAKAGDSFKRLQTISNLAWEGIKNEFAKPILVRLGTNEDEVLGSIRNISARIRTEIPNAILYVDNALGTVLVSLKAAVDALNYLSSFDAKTGFLTPALDPNASRTQIGPNDRFPSSTSADLQRAIDATVQFNIAINQGTNVSQEIAEKVAQHVEPIIKRKMEDQNQSLLNEARRLINAKIIGGR